MNIRSWTGGYVSGFPLFGFALLGILLFIGADNSLPRLGGAVPQGQPRRFADLETVTPTIEFQPGLTAFSHHNALTELAFSITTAANTTPVNLAARTLAIAYRDPDHRFGNVQWTWHFEGEHDNDSLLEQDERVRISLTLPTTITPKAHAATPFALVVQPAQGASLTIYQELPPQLQPLMVLH
jgi:archaellin